MTALDQRKSTGHSFFSVYKPGQGKYVRWGTVGGAALLILLGAWWMGSSVLASNELLVKSLGVVIWIAAGVLVTFWVVNKPNLAEFMIMTESEMRKVAWPSRRQVIVSTRVVIFLTLLLALLLWLFDTGFQRLFSWMHIL